MRVNGNLSVVGLLKDVKIDRLATDPVSPALSQIWFNTTDAVLRYYDGVQVHTIAKGGNLDSYLKLDGTSPMTGELTLSSTDQSASADAVAISKGHLDTQLALKEDVITGAATTITQDNLTAERAVVSDASGKVAVSAATAAEVGYLSGVTSAIQTQLDSKQSDLGYTPVNSAGDSMDGNLAMQGNRVTGLGAPVAGTDAARKIDIETALSGLDFQADVEGSEAVFDDQAPVAGRYIYVDGSNFTNPESLDVAANDIVVVDATGAITAVAYDVSVAGEGALAWDRSTNTFTRYNGTDWAEFGGLAGVTAGIGLSKSGNTINVNLGAGIAQLPTDEVGIDIAADSGLMLTVDGTTDSTDTAATLAVRLDGASLSKGNDGVRIAVNGVTESMLNASVAGNGIQGGAGSALSVVADTGISVSATGVALDTAYTDSLYLALAGGTMTGALTLSGDATNALHAVTKQQLDAAVSDAGTEVADLTTRMEAGYFVYDGTASPATSHTVTHNMGNKYVSVVVVDASDEVVLADSITYTDSNSLTVTFSSAEGCRVIVTGLKAAA